MSASFQRWCNVYGITLTTTPAGAPWQHGQVESLQRVLRRSFYSTYDEMNAEHLKKQDLLNIIANARNEMARHAGAQPCWTVLGRLPRLPPGAEDLLDRESLVGLASTSPEGRERLIARELAMLNYKKFEAQEKIGRLFTGRVRPTRGFWMAGDKCTIFRSSNPLTPHRGRWEGVADVVATKGQSSIFVHLGGRLYKCAPEQLSALTAKQMVVHQDVETYKAHHLSPEVRAKLMKYTKAFDIRHEIGLNPSLFDEEPRPFDRPPVADPPSDAVDIGTDAPPKKKVRIDPEAQPDPVPALPLEPTAAEIRGHLLDDVPMSIRAPPAERAPHEQAGAPATSAATNSTTPPTTAATSTPAAPEAPPEQPPPLPSLPSSSSAGPLRPRALTKAVRPQPYQTLTERDDPALMATATTNYDKRALAVEIEVDEAFLAQLGLDDLT